MARVVFSADHRVPGRAPTPNFGHKKMLKKSPLRLYGEDGLHVGLPIRRWKVFAKRDRRAR